MADEVEIVNFGEGGVASEATLASLTRAIEKLAASTGKDPKAAAGKLQQLHNDATKSGITIIDDFNKEKKKETTATKTAASALNKFTSRVQGAMLGAVGSVVGGMTGFANELIQGGTDLSSFSQHIPILGKLLGPLASYLDNTAESFRSMSSVGAGFNNNLETMRLTSARMGVTLDEFQSLVVNNSDALAALGTSVNGGVMRFAAMNKNLKATGDFRQLTRLGFTVEDINEGMANYVRLQGMSGKLQNRSTTELASSSASYMETLDRLSKLTGKQRDQIAKELENQALDASIRAMQNQFKEGSVEMQNFRTSLGIIENVGGPAGQALKDLLDGMPSSADTMTFLGMLGDAGPAVQDALEKIGDGADPQILLNALGNAGGDLEKYAGLEGDARSQFVERLRIANPLMADFLDGAGQMITQGKKTLQEVIDEQGGFDEPSDNIIQFNNAVRDLRSQIQTNFIESGLFSNLAGQMGELTKFLEDDKLKTSIDNLTSDLAGGFSEVIDAFKSGGIEKALDQLLSPDGLIATALTKAMKLLFSSLTTAIVEGIKALWESMPVVTALISAIGTLFAVKKVVDIANGARRLLGYEDTGRRARSPSTTPGNIRGSRGRGVGAQLAGLGRGIGAGLGGMAGGIIRGISSALAFAGGLAGPIALGAGAIGLAIVAIGAGIAGATWLVGAALPKFAEGMQSFTDLDGRALRSAALGITAISTALIAFGAANVVSAIGNIAGDILNGINSLFGGTTPFEKLEEFSNLDIDSVKVQQNAKALAAFGEAMGSLNLGSSGFSNMMSNLFDGITNFFGGTTGLPIDQINEFARYNFDSEKIRSNADAIIAFGEGMSAISRIRLGSSFTNMVSALFDGITEMFGGSVQIPYQKMIEFGEQDLDQDAIKGNAEVLKAFGEALSSVPKIDKERSGGLFGAVAYIFRGGVQLPWDKMVAFGEVDLDKKAIKGNAEVLKAFGEALQSVPEINAERTGGLFGGIASVFAGGVEMPWDHLKEFGNIKGIDKTGIKDNAESLTIFGTALQGFPEINAERVGGFFGGFADIFAGEVVFPWDKVKEFGAELLDPNSNITPNSTSISNFATALNAMPEIDSQRVGGIIGGLTDFLLGSEVMPWDKVKEFGAELLDPNDIIVANVGVLNSFAEAMGNMPQLPTNRKGGALGWLKDMVAGVEDPLEPFAAFGAYSLDATKIANNMSAISSYSTAISEIPTINNTQLSRISKSLIDFAKSDWNNLVSFGNDITLPSENILRRTSVIQNFATQLNAIPTISTDIDKLIDDINLFTKSGGRGNNFDWDKIIEFGNLGLDGVTNNAQVVKDLATKISEMPGINPESLSLVSLSFVDLSKGLLALNDAAISELTIEETLVSRLERISTLGPGLGNTAESLQTLANVEGLGIQFEKIKEGLDTDAVRTYNDAIETLIDTIEDLKDSLSDVSTMQASANTAMSNIQISAQNTTDGLGRMGVALDSMISELRVANEYNKEVSRNTKGITGSNVGSGYVSKMP